MKVVCLFQMREFQMSEILMLLAQKIAIALRAEAKIALLGVKIIGLDD
ncbi:hypothetical protein [Thalassotalea agariperforans]